MTTLAVRKGQGEVYGEGAAFVIDARPSTASAEPDCASTQAASRRFDDSIAGRRSRSPLRHVGFRPLRLARRGRLSGSRCSTAARASSRPTATSGSAIESAAGAPCRPGHWAWIDPVGLDLGGRRTVGIRRFITVAGRSARNAGVDPRACTGTRAATRRRSSDGRGGGGGFSGAFPFPPAPSVESRGSLLGLASSIYRPIG